MSGKLVILRHGESEWNKTGQWTGLTDIGLTEKGFADAKKMGEKIRDIHFDKVYTSNLIRTKQTLDSALKTQGQSDLPHEKVEAINERDYGEYTGMNKWEVRDKVGEDHFNSIRRDFDCIVPGGETLKMVCERATPFYLNEIVPQLLAGKNILLVAHGNSIRALVKYIENISDTEISNVEMIFGTILIFTVDADGREITKEIRQADITPTHA